MKKIFDAIFSVLLTILLVIIIIYRDVIIREIAFIYATYNTHETKNDYTKDYDYLSLKRTDNFVPKNKEELMNIIYTILDDGMEHFTFHCDKDYESCEEDLKNISDNGLLSYINNYIHPYNSFDSFNLTINNYGVVEIYIYKTYNENEINFINTKIKEIISNNITNDMNTYDKIKVFHDYIINNTTYDEEEGKRIINNENITSHKAYDLLVNGKGVCEGYTDILAIFLNELGINNIKISANNHIWNALYLDNKWQHIDMTWDDPVSKKGINMLIHDYFMISTNELINKDTKHIFDTSLYKELN